jgi:ubiquinone/menaquinone biosynthesis C-methylase UbiE
VATELHVTERDGRLQRVRVPDEGLTIGRKPPPFGASYCTTNSAVSRLHCRLARLGDGWQIEDLNSANGTNVNGELVDGSAPVRPGDLIAIGGTEHGLIARLVEFRPMFDSVEMTDAPTAMAHFAPLEKIRTSYDIVAEKYANELADDMVARPLERGMMLAFSELVNALGEGVVGDVGCGPGHIAKHVETLGVRTVGFDISAAMIEQARQKFPTGDFRLGSMMELPIPTDAWLGAIALYSTLHSPADDRARIYKEMARVVRSGGYMLHGFYVSAPDQPPGSEYHLERWFGLKVDLPTYFVSIDDAAAEMDAGGFEVLAALVREPMMATELPARRCYMLGKRR